MANRPKPNFDEFVEWFGRRKIAYLDSDYLYVDFPLDPGHPPYDESIGYFISKAVAMGLYVNVCWGHSDSDYVEGVLVEVRTSRY